MVATTSRRRCRASTSTPARATAGPASRCAACSTVTRWWPERSHGTRGSVAEGLEKLASGPDTSSSVGSSGMGVHWPVQDPPGEVRPGAGTTRAATTVGGQGPGAQVAGKAKPRKPAGLWFEPLPAVPADRRRPVAVDRWQLLTRRSPGLVLAALHSSEEHRRVSTTVDRRLHTIETWTQLARGRCPSRCVARCRVPQPGTTTPRTYPWTSWTRATSPLAPRARRVDAVALSAKVDARTRRG